MEDAVPEQSNAESAHVGQLLVRIPLRHLTAVHGLVERREHLRAEKRGSEDLVLVVDDGLISGKAHRDVQGDHVLAHSDRVPPAPDASGCGALFVLIPSRVNRP